MRQPAFDYHDCLWDRYRDFYIHPVSNHAFAQFHTGEMIVNQSSFDPDQRKFYKELNVRIVSTADDDCPALYNRPSDAERIPKSWLTYSGQQFLLIDYDHLVAVGLSLLSNKRQSLLDEEFPERFRNGYVRAYYAGPKSPPTGQRILVERDTPFTPKQLAHLEEIKNACETWYSMSRDQPTKQDERARYLKTTPRMPMSAVVNSSFADMNDADRMRIAVSGYERGSNFVLHKQLYIKPRP